MKFHEKSADYAVGANDCIGAAEISKQILETVKLLDNENAPRDTAEHKEKTAWKTPRLTIDKDGFWLGNVNLPTVTRFTLKNDPSNDGTFTLDVELEVTL